MKSVVNFTLASITFFCHTRILAVEYTHAILHKDPLIILIDQFITNEEADYIIKEGQSRLSPSLVDDQKEDSMRTSWTATISNSDPIIYTIISRAALILDMPPSHAENVQVVHYEPWQHYGQHCDFFPELLAQKNGFQRIFSCFIYLNDVPSQSLGSTFFPELNLAIQPKKGSAVIWRNVDEHGACDYRTMHAGLPVLYGEKWGMNLWFCNRPLN